MTPNLPFEDVCLSKKLHQINSNPSLNEQQTSIDYFKSKCTIGIQTNNDDSAKICVNRQIMTDNLDLAEPKLLNKTEVLTQINFNASCIFYE